MSFGLEFLGCMVGLYLTLRGTGTVFKVATPVSSLPAMYGISSCSLCQHQAC
jgi:hypothetical protein